MDGWPWEELQRICRDWAAAIQGLDRREERMAYFQTELPALLVRRPLFEAVLRDVLGGHPGSNQRHETLFGNEFILYRDPARLFSLRLYIFGPGEHTFVHDHSAWGVSGPAFGSIEVLRYRRSDPGADPWHAPLALSDRRVLRPGETEATLPLDPGIHRTGNPGVGSSLMVSVYGTPLRRLYIQRFDLRSGRVQRVYPPRLKRRILAEQALKAMEGRRAPN